MRGRGHEQAISNFDKAVDLKQKGEGAYYECIGKRDCEKAGKDVLTEQISGYRVSVEFL